MKIENKIYDVSIAGGIQAQISSVIEEMCSDIYTTQDMADFAYNCGLVAGLARAMYTEAVIAREYREATYDYLEQGDGDEEDE